MRQMFDSMNIRLSTRADAAELASLHCDAWRYAYRGIIPGISLERMIARHGPAGWERMHRSGLRALVLEFDKRVAGVCHIRTLPDAKCPSTGRNLRTLLEA